MSRIIEVIVSPTGETTIQTKGYAGGDCLQASKFLEDALGVVASEQRTAEFFETTTAEQHLQHKNRDERGQHPAQGRELRTQSQAGHDQGCHHEGLKKSKKTVQPLKHDAAVQDRHHGAVAKWPVGAGHTRAVDARPASEQR